MSEPIKVVHDGPWLQAQEHVRMWVDYDVVLLTRRLYTTLRVRIADGVSNHVRNYVNDYTTREAERDLSVQHGAPPLLSLREQMRDDHRRRQERRQRLMDGSDEQ